MEIEFSHIYPLPPSSVFYLKFQNPQFLNITP
ncbi:hypothetical protein SAMN05216420_11711 [Nitrosospira sp. Nl5]|nr:hypothetical protein SAMN05216420_11711 [Nitrosospira sp. Nl5]